MAVSYIMLLRIALLTFSLNDQVDYIIHLAAAISVAESMSDPGFWNFVIFISSFDGRI